MLRIKMALAFLGVLFWSFAPIHAQDKKSSLTVSGGNVTWNGKSFKLPSSKDDLVAALGEPDRVQPLTNEILIWDKLGLFAYIRPGDKKAFSLNVALGDMRKYLKFAPKTPFSGTLLVDGAAITSGAEIETINRTKKGEPFRPGALKYNWRANGDGLAYYLNRGTSEDWTEKGPIVEFSVEWFGKK